MDSEVDPIELSEWIYVNNSSNVFSIISTKMNRRTVFLMSRQTPKIELEYMVNPYLNEILEKV